MTRSSYIIVTDTVTDTATLRNIWNTGGNTLDSARELVEDIVCFGLYNLKWSDSNIVTVDSVTYTIMRISIL